MNDHPEAVKYLLVGLCGSALVLALLGSCLRPESPNAELVRTTRIAVEMAERAREDAADARRTALALRVLALAAGTVAPLVIAYLIYKLEVNRRPSWDEVAELSEDLPERSAKELPERRQLELRQGEEERRRP